jgi:hypothetical protein
MAKSENGPTQRPPPKGQPGGMVGNREERAVDVRAGQGHDVLRCGGHQTSRRTTRARAARPRTRGASTPPGGRGEDPPCAGPRPHQRGPRPNPKARQAGAPRACPPRASPVTATPQPRCRRGCLTSPQWRFCPFCGNQLQPTHSNAHRPPQQLCGGTAHDGSRLNKRFPPRVPQRTPPQGRQGPPTPCPRPPQRDPPPRSYADAVRRRPYPPPQRNSRGAIRPQRNHTAPRVCECGWARLTPTPDPVHQVQRAQPLRGHTIHTTGVQKVRKGDLQHSTTPQRHASVFIQLR